MCALNVAAKSHAIATEAAAAIVRIGSAVLTHACFEAAWSSCEVLPQRANPNCAPTCFHTRQNARTDSQDAVEHQFLFMRLSSCA